MAVSIKDVYPGLAQFISGLPIELTVELVHSGTNLKQMDMVVNIYHLAALCDTIKMTVAAAGKSEQTIHVTIPSKDADCNGYGADVYLYEDGVCIDESSTAFDVVSNWRKSTRYGFLSDFGVSELGDEEDVKLMRKLHLNIVQFYDWMYRHDQFMPPEDEYTDLMGKASSLPVIREKISLCHKYGMKATAYGAVYAASRDFYEQHPDWALYDSSGKVLDFIHIFYLMNIAEESPWHQHIIEQFKSAIEGLQFDGIHMDTYGAPKIALSALKGDGGSRMMRLDEQFPKLINNTRKALEHDGKDICLIFNNVGNWPVDTVALAAQDAIYIEVWNPYERYHHLKQIIQTAKWLSGGKPVILAAYLKPYKDKTDESGAEGAALLLTAAIVANGGYHLLLGENRGVLTQGYYVDYSTMDDGFMREIRNYYDFMIRYMNLFYDNDLRDVSMTHADGDNIEYKCDFPYSTYGEADKVWMILHEKPGLKTMSLINLCGVSNDLWNEAKEEPKPVHDLKLSILVESQVKSVYAASPDSNRGRAFEPDYTIENAEKGITLVITLPQLKVWTLLVVELKE